MEMLNEINTYGKILHQPVIFHGPVELRKGLVSKNCHLHLHRDFLIVTNCRYNVTCKIKYVIPLISLWMDGCVVTDFLGPSRCRKSIFLGWPMENFIATFRSSNEKREWQSILQRYIDKKKETEGRKSVSLEILTEDIPCWSTSFTVTSTNLETVNDIIEKLRPLLGIPLLGIRNAEEEYQLWFSSNQKEAPFPLIGHENPYAINMNNLQNDAFMALGGPDLTSYLDIQKVVLQKQCPHVQGRFILKPRDPPRSHQHNSSEITVKRICSLINRIFRRGPSADYDCLDSPDPITGCLFGKSLVDVCKDGSLPTAVLDMLSLIDEKGPSTEGIFRKTANINSCKVLKERLDSGEEVDFSRQSVLVVASVLKDFLRNIQGSLMTTTLYSKWLGVIGPMNEKAQIQVIRSLLEQLPKPNAALLKRLFEVLHHIERCSSKNQMTSYNLSVCIAPNILWKPSSCNSGFGNDISKKICLVEFILDNYIKIFGEDNSSSRQEDAITCNRGETLPGIRNNFIHFDEIHAAFDPKNNCPKKVEPVPRIPSAPLDKGGLIVNIKHSRDVTMFIKQDTFRMMTSSGSDHPVSCS